MNGWIHLGAASAAMLCLGASPGPIAYPDGFRSWTHVTSGLLGPDSPAAPKYEGVHHIYANAAALEGYRTGRFPNGAVIVYDQWTAAHSGAGATSAGVRKFVDVMERDSRRFAGAGGWGYAEFEGPERRRVAEIEAAPQACDGCHAMQAPGGDRIFTDYRD